MQVMPEALRLRTMSWQLFVTLTFRDTFSVGRYTINLFGWLREVAHVGQIHFKRMIWVARLELGAQGSLHYHLCIAGLGREHLTLQRLRIYAQMWYQRAGLADIQLYDRARDGVGYVLKRLPGNGVRLEDDYPPMLSDSLLQAVRRGPM